MVPASPRFESATGMHQNGNPINQCDRALNSLISYFGEKD